MPKRKTITGVLAKMPYAQDAEALEKEFREAIINESNDSRRSKIIHSVKDKKSKKSKK